MLSNEVLRLSVIIYGYHESIGVVERNNRTITELIRIHVHNRIRQYKRNDFRGKSYRGNSYRGNNNRENYYRGKNYRRNHYGAKEFNNKIYQPELNNDDTNSARRIEKIEKILDEMKISMDELNLKNTEQIVLDDDFTNNLSTIHSNRHDEQLTKNGKPLTINFMIDGDVILCKKKNNLLFARVSMCGHIIDALIDSGASRSCIDISKVPNEEMKPIKPSNTRVLTANNSTLKCYRKIETMVHCGTKILKTNSLKKLSNPIIIGNDILKTMLINGSKEKLEIMNLNAFNEHEIPNDRKAVFHKFLIQNEKYLKSTEELGSYQAKQLELKTIHKVKP
ncbi:hypothetical protein SNEBB_007722, partial [Seison nebaliae]